MKPGEVRDLPVSVVFNAIENINRIRSYETELVFRATNAAMNGSQEFVEELKLMRLSPEQRRKYEEAKSRLWEKGFNVIPG